MAQRDEGLDRLEAFIATTAQVRATLQRDDGRVRELGERLGEYFGDTEGRLEDLDDAIEAFDAKNGDDFELLLGLAFVLAVFSIVGVMIPITWTIAIGFFLSHEVRKQVVESADNAILAYRALSEASERLEPRLVQAGEEAEEAFDELDHVAAGAYEALAEPWLPILTELGPALRSHFPEH